MVLYTPMHQPFPSMHLQVHNGDLDLARRMHGETTLVETVTPAACCRQQRSVCVVVGGRAVNGNWLGVFWENVHARNSVVPFRTKLQEETDYKCKAAEAVLRGAGLSYYYYCMPRAHHGHAHA